MQTPMPEKMAQCGTASLAHAFRVARAVGPVLARASHRAWGCAHARGPRRPALCGAPAVTLPAQTPHNRNLPPLRRQI